jgi:phosphoglucosamine mutase
LSELTESVSLFPQRLINVPVPKGFDFGSFAPLQAEQRLVEAELGASGRVLIRPSGTEPLLRVMVEASSVDAASHAAERIAAILPRA